MQRDVFGQHGDFTTAPEVSQMYGEVCACIGSAAHPRSWLVCGTSCRRAAGCGWSSWGPARALSWPTCFRCGADVIRSRHPRQAASRFPAFMDGLAVSFVEVSPKLRSDRVSRRASHPSQRDSVRNHHTAAAEGGGAWAGGLWPGAVSCGAGADQQVERAGRLVHPPGALRIIPSARESILLSASCDERRRRMCRGMRSP